MENIIGVPVKTTSKGATVLVGLGLFILVALLFKTTNTYSFEARVTDGIVLLFVGAFLAYELGVRLPSKNWQSMDSVNLVGLILVLSTIVYAFASMFEWILPEWALGARIYVLSITILLAVYSLFTKR